MCQSKKNVTGQDVYTRAYTYNKEGDVASIETKTAMKRFTYEYDAKGNWTKRTEVYESKDYADSEHTSVVTRQIVY